MWEWGQSFIIILSLIPYQSGVGFGHQQFYRINGTKIYVTWCLRKGMSHYLSIWRFNVNYKLRNSGTKMPLFEVTVDSSRGPFIKTKV